MGRHISHLEISGDPSAHKRLRRPGKKPLEGSDAEERVRRMSEKITSLHLRIGFGLKLADQRKWSVYIPAPTRRRLDQYRRDPWFSEHGVFFGEAGSADLLPHGAVDGLRSAHLPDMSQALDFVIKTTGRPEVSMPALSRELPARL